MQSIKKAQKGKDRIMIKVRQSMDPEASEDDNIESNITNDDDYKNYNKSQKKEWMFDWLVDIITMPDEVVLKS